MSNNLSFLATTGSSDVGVSRNIPTTTIRMAIAVVAIIPIITAYPFFQRYFVNGITIGAVKE